MIAVMTTSYFIEGTQCWLGGLVINFVGLDSSGLSPMCPISSKGGSKR
ncbi:4269_t:CDS:2 [Funneliformis geosporum]|nr:4269_t:CDS:2 [Funneliformis geosporum]